MYVGCNKSSTSQLFCTVKLYGCLSLSLLFFKLTACIYIAVFFIVDFQVCSVYVHMCVEDVVVTFTYCNGTLQFQPRRGILDDNGSSLSDVSQASLIVPSANDSASTTSDHTVPRKKSKKNSHSDLGMV